MPFNVFRRLAAGEPMTGLFIIHEVDPIGPIIDSLILIWAASEAEEWLEHVRYLPI